ncbi:hypothetical protein J3Q64DRAFT_1829961 [Phycomyces blakesleeanus]|uniref:Uncharacterized protein n=2 Tax=Phycomyces blakesleeanus TaxID=4837 RepID=A0A162UXD5_PHYB8|nr:hypothetical protein PHYBLDRAFT_163685 [Phycomyces blakesleeanus NRRL 1555(-)]OAD78583.1 hypothetical protein PHYBLDRAFT_163685 [Phycomyces blakesleeanus NRRL 1555(-)]|eukprot:XP_018296623.1 hypothetical protein PHYBLDRAFT_163685 [Phycomyces blakesleeanus NRRL 1555(-)]
MTSYPYFEDFRHKRVHTPTDWESADHKQKRCVTDSVINDMAAMSLDSTTAGKFSLSYPSLFNTGIDEETKSIISQISIQPVPGGIVQQVNNVVSIPDMDEYLSQQDLSDDENDINIDLDNKALVEANVNGSLLLMEMRPGEKKLRIPEFVLNPPTELGEGQSSLPYKYYLETLEKPVFHSIQEKPSSDQEIREEPTNSYMDID